MEIQGEEEQIDRVIQSIDSGRYVFIERMDVKTIPVSRRMVSGRGKASGLSRKDLFGGRVKSADGIEKN